MLDLDERFWRKVDLNGPRPEYAPHLGPCWLWLGSKGPLGYGGVRRNGKLQRAHRVAYELDIGPIPDGLELDHLCRTPSCVRPSHMEPVTHRVNTLRGNTVSARAAAVTHCPQGHPYDEANTYRKASGKRECRACHRQAEHNRWVRTHPRADADCADPRDNSLDIYRLLHEVR